MRPGRLDRKVEVSLPNEVCRMDILKIHAAKIQKHGEIDFESVIKLSEGFNGADMVCACVGQHRVCILGCCPLLWCGVSFLAPTNLIQLSHSSAIWYLLSVIMNLLAIKCWVLKMSSGVFCFAM